jgi:hypothetical protein
MPHPLNCPFKPAHRLSMPTNASLWKVVNDALLSDTRRVLAAMQPAYYLDDENEAA